MLQRWLFFSSVQRETASSTIQAVDFHPWHKPVPVTCPGSDSDHHRALLHAKSWPGQSRSAQLIMGLFLPMQPLVLRRLEHEKRRKEIKEQWHRAQRKLVSGWVCAPNHSLEQLVTAPLRVLGTLPFSRTVSGASAMLGDPGRSW